MRISDWSSDVCSSDLLVGTARPGMTVLIEPDIAGRVTAVGSTIDPATRSVVLKAEIPAGPGIIAGRAPSMTLSGPAPAGAVSVPTGESAQDGEQQESGVGQKRMQTWRTRWVAIAAQKK